MIRRLYVHNFRCLENFELPVSGQPSVLLIGKNGSGKTTVGLALEILQKIADTLRERARIRGEIATLTAEGKLSALMVFAIPIILFFWMKSANPTYMAPLLNTDIGRTMLLMAAISECVGMIIIWKMVSMEV